MIIRNNSTTSINISGYSIRPGESFEASDCFFGTLAINTIGGHIIITTAYAENHIENYGCIKAEEGEFEGISREILVYDKTNDLE